MCLSIYKYKLMYRKILYPSSCSLKRLYSSDFDIIHAVHQSYFVTVAYQSVKLDSISLLFAKSQMHYSLIMAEITISCQTYYGFSLQQQMMLQKTAMIIHNAKLRNYRRCYLLESIILRQRRTRNGTHNLLVFTLYCL